MRLVLELGSMQKAAQRMGISYNKAWKIIEAMNIASGQPVIQKIRGGKGGGGAALTEYGYLILKEYDAIELMVNAFRQKLNTEINL
jgi:N-terminal domain of molybdenum-binding protein